MRELEEHFQDGVVAPLGGAALVFVPIRRLGQRTKQGVQDGGDDRRAVGVVAAADCPAGPVGVRGRVNSGGSRGAEPPVCADLGLVAGLDPVGVEQFLQAATEPAQPGRVQR